MSNIWQKLTKGRDIRGAVAALAITAVVLWALQQFGLIDPDGTGIGGTPSSGEVVEAVATPTPRPTVVRPLSPEAALRAAVDDALGESNRGGRKLADVVWRPEEGSVSVTWKADDSFSSSLILAGIERDTAAVLEAVADSRFPYGHVFIGVTFAVVIDGADTEAEVVTAAFGRGRPDAGDVWDAADNYWIAPLLRE